MAYYENPSRALVQKMIKEIKKHGTLQGKRVSMENPEHRKRIIAAAYSKARASMRK